MRLTALVAAPDHVCCRYRLAAFRPFLERAGHTLELIPWPRQRRGWLWALPALRRADVVIVQRRLPHTVLLRLLRGSVRRLVFDFDDAVFMNDSYDRRGPESPVKWLRFAAMTRAADAVVAGNAFLADEATRWAGRGKVRVIPTCVEPSRYPLATHTGEGPGVELVWIGSASTLQGLERSRPLWEELGRCCPGARLKLVCDRFLTFEHLPVVPVPWSEAGEAAALAAADIGVSWVPDDRWSQGKCGLKVLQYMAAGLPVIANPVGVQRDLARPGEGGFLAETADEWTEAIGRLANDAILRRRLGAMNRLRVEREFSVGVGAAAWIDLLDDLARERRAA
jgi:glycosyltransferase involved in cell wall biosynthesis